MATEPLQKVREVIPTGCGTAPVSRDVGRLPPRSEEEKIDVDMDHEEFSGDVDEPMTPMDTERE
eukprot:14443289-Heterocapsa_arctica.AAC.1